MSYEMIGPYRVLESLGKGGMGEVYLAEQTAPVRRRVAVKVIRIGMDTAEALARFDREREALAVMDHRSIAKVLDAGTTSDGRPYIVMEYVQGLPITTYCDQRQLTIRARLELLVQACHGVQHAHQKGVIHRDLKPSNILVKEEGDQPVPKVIDFGLARAVDRHRLGSGELHTQLEQIVGTPEYMSPEQAGLSLFDVDTRADVYALGVILYELLSGQLPFSPQDLRGGGELEQWRKIREDEPPLPSTHVRNQNGRGDRSGAAARRIDPARWLSLVVGDADRITMKALAKDRRHRYASAQALAEDLERLLAGEPVTAVPPSAWYRLNKWVQRHRALAVGGAVAAVGLIVGGVVSVWMLLAARSADQKRQVAELLANDGLLLPGTLAEADQLWPARPDRVRRFEEWIERTDSLVARLPMHRQRLLEYEQAVASAATEQDRVDARNVLERVQVLVEGLAGLAGPNGRLVEVKKGLERARDIESKTITDYADRWSAAIEAVWDRYQVKLKPQIGLVPVGADPISGLQEFAHWESGEVPLRRAEGKLQIREDSAIVLVLIPRGEPQLGRPESDPAPGSPGGDRTLVKLRPFLIGKYEITQAQWRVLTGDEPSNFSFPEYQEHPVSLAHPVEMVSFVDAGALARYGLDLPTEGQWEYACRAGTNTAWSCHADELGRFANFAESDGYVVTAPVGSFLPNNFGLHDMHGNVHEWCRGGWTERLDHGLEEGDGVVRGGHPARCVLRGGSFRSPPKDGCSWSRHAIAVTNRHVTYGLRAAARLR